MQRLAVTLLTTLVFLAVPLAAGAQLGKVARIGWIALTPGPTSA
jgi:hypothetical protein